MAYIVIAGSSTSAMAAGPSRSTSTARPCRRSRSSWTAQAASDVVSSTRSCSKGAPLFFLASRSTPTATADGPLRAVAPHGPRPAGSDGRIFDVLMFKVRRHLGACRRPPPPERRLRREDVLPELLRPWGDPAMDGHRRSPVGMLRREKKRAHPPFEKTETWNSLQSIPVDLLVLRSEAMTKMAGL